MLDLGLLAILFGKCFVIGDFHDDIPDRAAELRLEFLRLGRRVFHRIVQQGGTDDFDVSNVTLVAEDVGERNRMVNVGRGIDIFATLILVLGGCKCQCFQ